MITVKATKQSCGPAKQSRDDFVEQDNRKGRFVPVVFLLLLASGVAYLRSFLSIRAETQDDEKHEETAKDDGEDIATEDEQIGAMTDDDVTGSTDRRRGSSSGEEPVRIVLSLEAESALQNDFVKPDLGGQERAPVVRLVTDAFGEPVRPAIDTRSAPQSGDAGRIGGGGGGGGGGDERGNAGLPQLAGPADPLPSVIVPVSDPSRNRAPRISGSVYLRDTYGCQAFLISMLALLAGASDADGDSLRVVGVSANWGTISQNADGDFSFVHDAGLLGPVKLTYFVTDGFAVVPQVAYFNVVTAPPIVGTNGDDNLLGTQCADTIDGRDGDDNIDARDGNDLIVGGAGDDHIVAGLGNDVVYAGEGNDIVFAGAGNDIVFGGAGNDRIYGDDGDDTLMGEDGNDVLFGGAGNDIILAGAGDDMAQGDAGNDTLDGGDGNDKLDGGQGADVLIAGAGNDVIKGGDGDDVLFDGAGSDLVDGGTGDDHVVAAADGESDIYDGGADADTLDYTMSRAGLTVDLTLGVAFGDDVGSDEVANFESVIGGAGDDFIRAASASLSMDGAAGNDTLTGGAGDDIVADGTGDDVVHAGEGNDLVLAAADTANDVYDGGAGHDTLSYATATLSVTVDLARGNARGQDIGSDLIDSFEKIIGGSGDDHLISGSGSVSMTGGRGRDTFEFQRSDGDHEALLVRKITDFTVGDRIVAATFEISYLQDSDPGQTIADMFDDIYLSNGDNQRPVRFRFEQFDDSEFTFIDVHDRPDADEFFSIEVAGHHQLQFIVGVS